MIKLKLLPFCIVATVVVGCQQADNAQDTDNPLLSTYETPFQVPPFDKIKNEHFRPAFKAALEQRSEEHTSELQSRENLVCRLLLERHRLHLDIHSFPTRRSSDLKLKLLPFCIVATVVVGCQQADNAQDTDNPLLSTYETPFQVPPFDKIKNEHFRPAFKAAIEQ